MPKSYFEKVPLVSYDMQRNGIRVVAVDLLRRVKFREYIRNNPLVFYTYDIKDGETPEIVAHKYYGSTNYFWIVLLVNNVLDPQNDWPMTYENLIQTIKKKYGTSTSDGLEYAYVTTHHYEDSYGNEVDRETFMWLPYTERKEVKIYDWEMAENEAKRNIKLLDKKFANVVDKEMEDLMAKT